MSLKALEQHWKRLWIRVLVALMRQPRTTRPDWDARPMRVLFLRHDRIGDMIVSTGVMRGIARSHATITLDVLASPLNAALLDGSPDIGQVIVFDKRRLANYWPVARRLRRNRYDAVIDCMVTAPSVTTLLLMLATGARYRIGIANRGNDAAFTTTVAGEPGGAHMVDRLAALARAFGAELTADQRHPVIHLSDAERTWAETVWGDGATADRVLVNISAGADDRFWPDERYASVLRHLRARSATAPIRVIARPSEADRARRIAAVAEAEYVPTPGIRQAMALVASAALVFTPDTSVAHAASAFRTPCVAIYPNGSAEAWGLYGTAGETIEHRDRELRTLDVDRVLPALDRVWRQAATIGRD